MVRSVLVVVILITLTIINLLKIIKVKPVCVVLNPVELPLRILARGFGVLGLLWIVVVLYVCQICLFSAVYLCWSAWKISIHRMYL